MTNWINDEAQKHAESKAQKEQSDYLINFSNYWAGLINQIKSDVEQINNQPIWKDALDDKPITVKQVVSGYEILKSSLPSVSVIIDNQGKTIKVQTATIKDSISEYQTKIEDLKVESDGGRLYLKWYDKLFIIPEDASRYILSPIIEALKR